MSGKYKKYIVSGDDISEKWDEGGKVVNTDLPVKYEFRFLNNDFCTCF